MEADFGILLANAREVTSYYDLVFVAVNIIRAVGGHSDPRQAGEPDVVETDFSLQVAAVAAPHVEPDHCSVDRFIARIDRLDGDCVPAVAASIQPLLAGLQQLAG